MRSFVLCMAFGLMALALAAPAEAHIEYCDGDTYYEVDSGTVHRHRADCKDPDVPEEDVRRIINGGLP